MMRKFTRELRQQILDAFTAEHSGNFDPKQFLWVVRSSNGTHPAWAWFEWNDGKAAEEFRLNQARQFVHGLKVKFEVITTERSVGGVTVREVPAYLSPVSGRSKGGGYFTVDPDDPEHMQELRDQAATALQTWIIRYGPALEAIGSPLDGLTLLVAQLRPAVTEAA